MKCGKGNHPLYNLDTPWVHFGYTFGYLQAGNSFGNSVLLQVCVLSPSHRLTLHTLFPSPLSPLPYPLFPFAPIALPLPSGKAETLRAFTADSSPRALQVFSIGFHVLCSILKCQCCLLPLRLGQNPNEGIWDWRQNQLLYQVQAGQEEETESEEGHKEATGVPSAKRALGTWRV